MNKDYVHVEKAKPNSEIRERILEIRRAAQSSSMSKRKDIECWNMYNEIYNERDFDYLRKVGQYEYPAKMRWIGIQRKGINLLVSQQSRRPFPFSVIATDSESVEKKYNTKFSTYINTLYSRVKETNRQYTISKINLDRQMQQAQELIQQIQQAQQDPNIDPNQVQQMQMQAKAIQEQLPILQQQINDMKDVIDNNKYMNDKDIEKIEQYFRYNYKDTEEKKAQGGMREIRNKLNIKQKSIKSFISKCVTGKQYWFVDYIEGQKLPTINPIDAIKVYYPINDEVFWVQDGDWAVLEQLASFEQVKKEFGPYLTPNQIEYLKRYRGSVTPSAFVSTPGSGAYLHDNIYAGTINTSQSIRVWRIYYREERKILARRMPNPHMKGEYFTHFVDEDDLIKNPIRTNKGEELVTRYVDDVYEGVVIIDSIVPYVRKKPFVWRPVDDYSKVPLPIIGKTHNNISDRPYSLIWATKDLQILYNLLHYHRELMLAVSGVKGTIMDLSQKPEGMSMEEWVYQKKLGTGWIETVKKGRNVQTSFNQFKSYDDTVSPAVSYLDDMMTRLDQTMMQMIGISYQRLGQMVKSDQVGTAEMAIDQSALVTEILYNEHDECERMALTQAINLAARYCWTEGQLLNITDKDGSEFIKINPGELGNKDFDVYLENSTQEERNMTEIKQMGMGLAMKGQLSFQQALSLYNTTTLKDLEKKFEYYTEQMQEIQSENAQQGLEAEIQKEERLERLRGEIQGELENNKLQIEQAKLKFDEAKMQFDADMERAKLDIEQKKLDQERSLRMMEIASERETEGAYLNESVRSNVVSEQLSALELKMEAVLNHVQMNHEKDLSDKQHKVDMKKLDIDKAKALNKNKEKIVD